MADTNICNPCSCIQPKTHVNPRPSCPAELGECLIACNDILSCENAVGPCGQSGTFDLNSLNHNTSICTTPLSLKWSLKSYDKNLLNSASIDRNTGILTWVTSTADTAGKFASICYSISCLPTCEDCFPLEHVATFYVGIKDECALHSCKDCETCDPCTGICQDNNSNLSIQDGSNNSNIITNG